VVRGDQRLEDFLVAAKNAQGLLFVLAHQAAEFRDVGRKNRGELALDQLRRA